MYKVVATFQDKTHEWDVTIGTYETISEGEYKRISEKITEQYKDCWTKVKKTRIDAVP